MGSSTCGGTHWMVQDSKPDSKQSGYTWLAKVSSSQLWRRAIGRPVQLKTHKEQDTLRACAPEAES